MAILNIQFDGGTDEERMGQVIGDREVWVNTDNNAIYIGDGVTIGGNPSANIRTDIDNIQYQAMDNVTISPNSKKKIQHVGGSISPSYVSVMEKLTQDKESVVFSNKTQFISSNIDIVDGYAMLEKVSEVVTAGNATYADATAVPKTFSTHGVTSIGSVLQVNRIKPDRTDYESHAALSISNEIAIDRYPLFVNNKIINFQHIAASVMTNSSYREMYSSMSMTIHDEKLNELGSIIERDIFDVSSLTGTEATAVRNGYITANTGVKSYGFFADYNYDNSNMILALGTKAGIYGCITLWDNILDKPLKQIKIIGNVIGVHCNGGKYYVVFNHTGNNNVIMQYDENLENPVPLLSFYLATSNISPSYFMSLDNGFIIGSGRRSFYVTSAGVTAMATPSSTATYFTYLNKFIFNGHTYIATATTENVEINIYRIEGDESLTHLHNEILGSSDADIGILQYFRVGDGAVSGNMAGHLYAEGSFHTGSGTTDVAWLVEFDVDGVFVQTSNVVNPWLSTAGIGLNTTYFFPIAPYHTTHQLTGSITPNIPTDVSLWTEIHKTVPRYIKNNKTLNVQFLGNAAQPTLPGYENPIDIADVDNEILGSICYATMAVPTTANATYDLAINGVSIMSSVVTRVDSDQVVHDIVNVINATTPIGIEKPLAYVSSDSNIRVEFPLSSGSTMNTAVLSNTGTGVGTIVNFANGKDTLLKTIKDQVGVSTFNTKFVFETDDETITPRICSFDFMVSGLFRKKMVDPSKIGISVDGSFVYLENNSNVPSVVDIKLGF